MKDMILFPEDIDRLNLVLSQLVQKANLLLAVLINKDGRMLTSQGSLGQVDTVSMAALIAGNSASTLAIAQLMGETEFSTMYHQGKDKHIYIATVDENTFLSLVFDDRTNIDRVKVFARQFDRQLKSGLFQVYNKTEDQINLDLDTMDGFDQNAQQPAPYMPSPPLNQRPQETFDSRKDSFHINANQYTPQEKLNPNITEEIVFDIDSTKSGVGSQNPNDTNYIYLHNKIRETNKRKKDEL